MPPVDGELQRKLREFEDPRFGYRLDKEGELVKDLFDGPLPKGWVDNPADAGKRAKKAQEPDNADSAPTAPAGGLAPPYGDHKFKDLAAEYHRRTGEKVRVGTKKDDVIAMLEALDAGE